MNRLALISLLLVTSVGCGSRLESSWIQAGYNAADLDATKHITVAAWADDDELARLVARIASERVKFKKNYLVYSDGQVAPGWTSGCSHEEADIQGVLAIRVIDIARSGDDVDLSLEGRLMRCSDGAMLWRAEVSGSGDAGDEDLATFAGSYEEEFPTQASAMAIPLLVNLIDLLDALPDVTLTEEETFTKIELS